MLGCFTLLTAAAAAPAWPELQVDTSDGSLHYNISTGGKIWLVSSNLTRQVFLEGAEQTLRLKGTTRGNGQDALGAFYFTSIMWTAGDTNVTVVTQFREYRAVKPPAIVFSISYPVGAKRTNRPGGDSTPSASFPAFSSTQGMLPRLGYRSWSGNMAADQDSTTPMNYSQLVADPSRRATINSIANGPIALYEAHDGACIFLSPHSQFMTEQHRATPGDDGSAYYNL
jgi:hypothetical protein